MSISVPIQDDAGSNAPMPSLFRFLAFVGIVVGLIYGGMLALSQFYDPPQREITVPIPPDRFVKPK
jgi:hypothetical protein